MLEKRYVIEKGPKAIEWEKYEYKTMKAYHEMLCNDSLKEKDYQNFLEKNPSMIPGVYGIRHESGHAPLKNTVITQPRILSKRGELRADFLVISQDSLNIYPTLIEIETPSKKYFTASGRNQQTSEFTEAITQIREWQVLLEDTTSKDMFYKMYGIDEYLDSKIVVFNYILVYGDSNSEEFTSTYLNKMRGSLFSRPNEYLMSFRRLSPNFKGRNLVTTKLNKEELEVKYISETFENGPNTADYLKFYKNIEKAISQSDMEDDRKSFIIDRIPYWKNIAPDIRLMDLSDSE